MKRGRVMKCGKLGLEDTVFKNLPSMDSGVCFFSCNFQSKLKEDILGKYDLRYSPENHVPSMIGMWHALDLLLTKTNSYVCFFHCMETHSPYPSAVTTQGEVDCDEDASMDYSIIAQRSRDYFDRQIEWYHGFFPPSAINVYCSDHASEFDLTERNINVPLKITGGNIVPRLENRLFSYKNLYKLVYCLLESNVDMENLFEDDALIDVVDPYDKGFVKSLKRGEGWTHFSYTCKKRSKEYLKKYLQTTKVVTSNEEYYTINILGEETYYRDKGCKINLIDDPAYSKRIAELREKAGKFYNPWKERRQVAIDFYEYLGIKEKDIAAQCY